MDPRQVSRDMPEHEDDGSISVLTLSVLSGPCVTVSTAGLPDQETRLTHELRLDPEHSVIVGRAEGHRVPYLDPAYRPTTIVPGTGQTVLHFGGDGRDRCVSRGHFMLRSAAGGILLVNGVPRPGGSIRPPLNGTEMLAPARRTMTPAEEYLIARGTAVVLGLPNGAEVQIAAE